MKKMNKLIETLRGMADMLDGPQNAGNLFVPAIIGRFREAADTIERLEAENAALRAQQEQQNEPLTLDELREMDGEKIYIRYIGHCKNFCEDKTAPYYGKNEQYIQHYNGMLQACDLPLQYYGEEWLAYRSKKE